MGSSNGCKESGDLRPYIFLKIFFASNSGGILNSPSSHLLDWMCGKNLVNAGFVLGSTAVLVNTIFNILLMSIDGRLHVNRYHRAEKTKMVWPRQKYVSGENTKINYGLDTTGENEKRTSKKNVDGRSTSSHDNKKFRTIWMEKQKGMVFGFRKTATAV